MSDPVQHRNLYLHTYVCIYVCTCLCMLFDDVLCSDMFSLSFSLNCTYVHQLKWTSPRVTTSVSRLYFVYILACNWLNGNKVPVFSSIKHTILKHLKLLHILSTYFWMTQFICHIFLCCLLAHIYPTHQDTCFVYGTLSLTIVCHSSLCWASYAHFICLSSRTILLSSFLGPLIYLFVYDFL